MSTTEQPAMPPFEEIVRAIFEDKAWPKKLLIGAVLSLIPLVNFIALGYLYKYANQIRKERRIDLPAWDYWADLIVPGVYFFLINLAYMGLIMLIGNLLTPFSSVFYILIIIGYVAGPAFFTSALMEFQKSNEQWKSLLNFGPILGRVSQNWITLVIPSLCFASLFLLGRISWLLLMPAFFIGSIFYLAYATILYLEIDEQ